MQDSDEMQAVLMNLLAQVQRTFTATEMSEVETLATSGRHRQAVETVCRFASTGKHPLPMQARAMVFKLADRLGIDPMSLGLLD